jgi:UDP-N-acetylmuramyl pentapeptide phosphotransferase/UDP-N-acetylglucosamine-1-phosphate transferase
MKTKSIIGIIFVIASLIKLASLWKLIHWSWLERASDEPESVYFAPALLIIIGVLFIIDDYYKGRDSKG